MTTGCHDWPGVGHRVSAAADLTSLSRNALDPQAVAPCMPYNTAPDDWWKTFVDALPAHTAKLAVVRADGSPLVAPVWIDRDGEQIVFMTSAETIKGRSILRDGRVSLCLDNEQPPFDFVTISGTTTTSTDADELLEWSTRIAGRYMGADQAEAYGERNAVPPEMVVRVTPTNIVAKNNVAD